MPSTFGRSPLVAALALALFGGMLALAGRAVAGDIAGRVSVPNDTGAAQAAEGRPHYWRLQNGFLPLREMRVDARREIAVVLTGSGAEALGCEYGLRGGQLAPKTMVARAGATISIANRDGCVHELSAEGVAAFARAPSQPGTARSVSLAGVTGAHAVEDAIFPHVEGTLVVLDDLAACATTDAAGSYSFREVPAGDYTLKVFWGADEVASQAVTVPASGTLNVEPLSIARPAAH